LSCNNTAVTCVCESSHCTPYHKHGSSPPVDQPFEFVHFPLGPPVVANSAFNSATIRKLWIRMQLAQHENTIRETHDPMGQVGDSKLGQSNLQEARWQLNACFHVENCHPSQSTAYDECVPFAAWMDCAVFCFSDCQYDS